MRARRRRAHLTIGWRAAAAATASQPSGIEIPENAIPGMKISQRAASEGPLPMAFSFRSRSESEGRSVDCYAEAA